MIHGWFYLIARHQLRATAALKSGLQGGTCSSWTNQNFSLLKIEYWVLTVQTSASVLVDWQLVTGTPSFYLCSMWLLEISKEYVKPANEHSISCFPATFSVSILLGRNRLVHSVLSLSPRRCSVSRLNRPATYKQRTIGTRLETTALNTSFPISVCSRALWNRTELPW